MNPSTRIIGEYSQGISGPLLLLFGAIHGNESAGVKAIDLVIKMLEIEKVKNFSFEFRGKVVGLIGNKEAYKQKVRFIDEDLNRIWDRRRVATLLATNTINKSQEERELLDILAQLENIVLDYKPSEIVILDLHTTSSSGGIFTIPSNENRSLEIAKQLHAPVIKNMLTGVSGTLLHYFENDIFQNARTTIVTFESGQHVDPLSINRSIAACINCMRSIKMVDANVVENIHDDLLISYSKGLPKLTRLIYKHSIEARDHFRMLDGFTNFQPISEGQIIAEDKNGPVQSPLSGMILMPLYQSKGNEGFFIIREER
jgi:succinylglutamate desuccinylase